MKILITSDWYAPAINGVVTSIQSLEQGLKKQGHEVRILTLSGNRHSRREGDVTYIGSAGVGRIYPDARLRTAFSGRYIRAILAWKPDVVHSQCEFSTFFMARRIASLCGVPLIHTYHTVYEDFTHYFSPSVRFGKYMAAVFSRKILAKTDRVIAPTDKVRNMLLRYGVTTPVTVIPSGLDLAKFGRCMREEDVAPGEDSVSAGVCENDRSLRKHTGSDDNCVYSMKFEECEYKICDVRKQLGIRGNDRVLLYLGRLAKEKNIEEILCLLAKYGDEAVSKGQDWKLLLVGDGPYREELTQRVSELGISGHVIFAGMVPPQDVVKYYALGDVFLSASESETQGLTYIEAMAAGLPLLCRKDACLSGVIADGENGYVYTEEPEFARKLKKLLSDERTRQETGRRARQTALERFSSDGFAAHALAVYRDSISEILGRESAA